MANKIITLVIDTLEQSLDSVLAAAINEVHTLGHTVKEVRVTDDSGEVKVPLNTIEGVTVTEPVPQVTVPAEPTPEEPPAEAPPVDAPVDPTQPPVDDTTPSAS